MKASLAPSTPVTARDPKGTKFMSIVEAAYNKALLPDDEAQRVNDAKGLGDLIAGFIAENRSSNKYKSEEVASNYGYLSGYKKPRYITDQCTLLRELFYGLGFPNTDLLKQVQDGNGKLPTGAEGFLAIPNIWKPEVLKLFGGTYSGAVQKVLDVIKQIRKGRFHNYREGQVNNDRLRQSVRTLEFFQKLSEEQGNPDILIVPAQFSIRHRGRSVRRAREVFLGNEFGLGAFAVGIMLLTHPERLQNLNDLWIDCAGDEFDNPDSVVRFDRSPCFLFSDDSIGFGTHYVVDANSFYGSASGLVSQK